MHRVVYRATSSRSAKEVCALLAKGGLHPRMLDDPDPNPIVLYAAKGTYSIRVAVAPDEVPRAGELLRAHEQRHAGGVSRAVSNFRRQLLLSLPIAAVATTLLVLLRENGAGEDTGDFAVFVMGSMAGLTIASLVVVSQVAAARRRLANDTTSRGWRPWVRRILMIQAYDSPFVDPDATPPESGHSRDPGGDDDATR